MDRLGLTQLVAKSLLNGAKVAEHFASVRLVVTKMLNKSSRSDYLPKPSAPSPCGQILMK